MKTPLQRFVLRWGAADNLTAQDSKSEASAEEDKNQGDPATGSKRRPAERNHHSRRGGSAWLLLALLVAWGGGSTGCQETAPQAGVISTENAGRVMGSLVRSDSGKLEGVAEIRLVRLDSAGPTLAMRTSSDAAGGYSFESVKPGRYRVDAQLSGGLSGSSAVFEVKSGATSNLVVVLVVAHSFQFVLVPGAGQEVVSVWAGDPDRTVSKSGQSWSVPVVPGTELLLGAILRKSSGAETTLHYRLVWRDGAAGLLALDTGVEAPKVDSVILTAPVTLAAKDSLVAHWVVDSSRQALLKDKTGHGFDLSLASSGVWQHLPDTNLTQKPTGRILYQAKIWLDKYPSSSLWNSRAVVVGFYEGLKLVVTDHGQVQAAGQRGDGAWSWYAPETRDSLVPLGKWVEVAVGADQKTGDFYVWIDGKPVPTYAGASVSGSKTRVATTSFVLGEDGKDGQQFDGKIAEVKVWNKFVLGEGIASGVDKCIDWLSPCPVVVPPDTTKKDTVEKDTSVAPRKIDSLVAHWVVDSTNQSKLLDKTGNGFDLTRGSTGVWSRANDTNLTQKVTGRILYQAKIWLDKYPSSSLHNGRAVVVGFYEGLKLLVTDHGQVQAGGQRGDGAWNWFAPETKDSLIPLGKWVEVAVGADQATGDFHVWIDGKAVPTWMGSSVSGSKTRVATSTFVLGQDAVDGQKFDGKIAEVKVWNKFVLGAGIASGVDKCIDWLSPCPVVVPPDTTKKDTVVAPRKIDSLVAHWVVDSTNQPKLLDKTGNGFDLTRSGTGVWSRANDTNLTQKPTGRILYQAKIWLDKYPSSSLHNGRAVVVGFYEGLKLLVTDRGRVQAGGQRGNGSWSWYAPETKDSLVPLGRWVEVAVGADQAAGDFYVWIDGKAVPTLTGTSASGVKTRVATSTFVLGQDAVDGQKFDGKIAEVKVWNKFVLGAAIASGGGSPTGP